VFVKILASMACFSIMLPNVWANEVQDFVVRLKTEYEATLPIKAFSLSHHYLNKHHRDLDYWDYQQLNRNMSLRVVEVDFANKHFYDNDVHYLSGGRLIDRVQFQNDKESYFYEKNGGTLGKHVFKQSMGRFDRAMGYFVMNLDFMALRPLLQEGDIQANIRLKQDAKSGTSTLIHKTSDDTLVDYKFRHNPLRLVSVNHRGLGGIFTYDDFQTTRGITYARSVKQFYGGATEPDYIVYNGQFEILDKVDPGKLQLPPGFGQRIPDSDGSLVSEEVAKDLYLVSDASAWSNSLFKVSGDNIMLFGANSPTFAKKAIDLIRQEFPDKKISSVYVTHGHRAEIAGLEVYVEEGIEILADEYTIAAIKAHFAKHMDKLKFRTISHEQVIDGVHFYVLENLHAKRQSFAYFGDSEIIFQSHLLHIAYDNTIAKVIPSYTKAFVDFVRGKQLKLKRIVGNHRNNNISVEVMNKTYDALM